MGKPRKSVRTVKRTPVRSLPRKKAGRKVGDDPPGNHCDGCIPLPIDETAGSILVADGTGGYYWLGPGDNGDYLRMSGGYPAWVP